MFEDAETTIKFKLVITGGPCSGKSTAMERLPVFLRERGFRVFVVPEAATMLFLNGASVDDFINPKSVYAFQQYIIRTQISIEDSTVNYALSLGNKQPCIILCDRGVLDGSAYCSREDFDRLLQEVNLDIISARDSRYDSVFHLVTAADGAEQFYTLENNAARSESAEEARQVDRKTQIAWSGHPHLTIIGNENNKTFEKKLEELTSAIAQRVGLPLTNKRARKYLLDHLPDISSLPNVQIFDVEKIILKTASNEISDPGEDLHSKSPHSHYRGREIKRFIRKRSQSRFSNYGLTVVKELETGEEVELKTVISARMYRIMMNTADKDREIIIQRRYCFLWNQQSFHIYQYLKPESGLILLLVQSECSPNLPPFLQVHHEIDETSTDRFSSHVISRKPLAL